jgi:RNA 3'-terminal phosphate cyclase (ATP)
VSGFVEIDGSIGEGGGQILRTALSLSLVTGESVRIENIRAGRERPGLQRQHLACVRAAVQVSNGSASGVKMGSQTLEFRPGRVRTGEFLFDVGTAGSTTLVLQTVLLPLCLAGAPSDVTVIGGTHNPNAPPYEFLANAFVPLVARMGPRIDLRLERLGFYPAGGGRIRAKVLPAPLEQVHLGERGPVERISAVIRLAKLPLHVAEREHRVLLRDLRMRPQDVETDATSDGDGPGNAVAVSVRCANVTEVFTGFGRKGLPGETVAAETAAAARAWIELDVPVGPHLADQLLLPLALAGGGSFRTTAPTEHATTNAEVIAAFLPHHVSFDEIGRGAWRVTVS